MPRLKLSQLAVDRLTTPGTHWDQTLPGFGLRISPKGRKTWICTYRVGGIAAMESLGTVAKVPKVEKARELARASMNKAKAGSDPREERRTAKAVAEAEAFTFADLVDRYVREYAEVNTKPATVYETKRILEKAKARWEKRAARSITKADVNALVEDVASRRLRKRGNAKGGSLVEANATLRCLRTTFRWAHGKDLVDRDPTAGVLKPLARETARDRVLDDREIKLLWDSCNLLGWPFGPLAKLLVLTAQRENEVAGMRRSELDLGQAIWTIPAERAKNGKAHVVHLSPMAIEVIEAIPNLGDLMFSTNGTTPVSGFSNAKERANKFMAAAAGDDVTIPHWTWHDLRRTVTTGLARLGIAPHVADKILNHSTGTIRGVAAVYNRHAYLDERKAALDSWSRFVGALVRPDQVTENVIPLRSA